jgi:hypothetical protein
MDTKAQQGIHEIVSLGNRIEMPNDIVDFLDLRHFPIPKGDRPLLMMIRQGLLLSVLQ